MALHTLTEEALVEWGHRIGVLSRPPLALGLRGSLGAGKSVLARAVARGAGVEGPIPSPTFNLVFRYPTAAGEIVHVDLYRVGHPRELGEIGWDEFISTQGILLVEWPERAGQWLPPDRWDVELRGVPGRPELRAVDVTRVGTPAPLPPLPAPSE